MKNIFKKEKKVVTEEIKEERKMKAKKALKVVGKIFIGVGVVVVGAICYVIFGKDVKMPEETVASNEVPEETETVDALNEGSEE